MTKTVLLDEIHVSLLVPKGLSSKRSFALRRIITTKTFDQELAQAIRRVLESRSSTKEITIALSR